MALNASKALSIFKFFKKAPKLPEEAASRLRLSKDLVKNEKNYTKAHNDCVDQIALRNKAQSDLMVKGIDVVTNNESVKRVGISVIKESDLPSEMISNYLERRGLNPKLNDMGEGVLDGFASKKAEKQGLTIEQYQDATSRDYLNAGVQGLKMTPKIRNAVNEQPKLVTSFFHFGKAKNALKETKMANLIDKHGSHLVYDKHGKIKSGSLQASSPEELARWLNGTEPVSHIKPDDIEIPLPNATHLLPPLPPEKLPVTPSRAQIQTQANGFKHLSPKEITEKQLAERDQRIAELDAKLRKQDPVALEKAIHNRDIEQVYTGIDVVRSEPEASAKLGANYLWQEAGLDQQGTNPLFSDTEIKQAVRNVGHAFGEQMANGHAKTLIQDQARVEAQHAKGKPIAEELVGHYQDKAMEKDLHMTVDAESGEKFYDTFDSTRQMEDAAQRYGQEAKAQLPRPQDNLYLNDEVTHVVPGFTEGQRRLETAGRTLPDTKHLLPPEKPSVMPSRAEITKQENAVQHLSPKEITEKQLAERDQRIAELDGKLREQDPVALEKAIHDRDIAQVHTGIDVAKGIMSEPAASAKLGANYLWQKAGLDQQGTNPLFSNPEVQQAEHTVSHSLGDQIRDGGHAVTMIEKQIELEAQHAKGKPIAEELVGHYQNKAMEKDLNMTVDAESGEKFYDTFGSTRQMQAAAQRYVQEAKAQLPRPQDNLYLNDEVTHFVPDSTEGWRRLETYDNENYRFIADTKDGWQKFKDYGSQKMNDGYQVFRDYWYPKSNGKAMDVPSKPNPSQTPDTSFTQVYGKIL